MIIDLFRLPFPTGLVYSAETSPSHSLHSCEVDLAGVDKKQEVTVGRMIFSPQDLAKRIILHREGIPISILLVKELECRPETRSMLQLPRLHSWESLEEVEILGIGVLCDCTIILAPEL